MASWGLLCPGQGAQVVGMGRDVAARYAEARAVFAEADDLLDIPISRLCFEGPVQRLNRTEICQPAILTTSWAILRALEATGGWNGTEVRAAAGLSLGEYTALVFAGALRFADALRLVRRRGLYMQEASDREPSGMLSLLGVTEEQAGRLAEAAGRHGVIAVANLNAPGQVVLSGAEAALVAAETLAPQMGIRRTRRLVVSGAFHSPLMQPAAEQLAAELAAVPIQRPRIPVVSNVTAAPVSEPETIRRLLAEQILKPVRWVESVRALGRLGITRFLEPGPGSVLTGLLKKILPDAAGVSVADAAALEAFAREAQA